MSETMRIAAGMVASIVRLCKGEKYSFIVMCTLDVGMCVVIREKEKKNVYVCSLACTYIFFYES